MAAPITSFELLNAVSVASAVELSLKITAVTVLSPTTFAISDKLSAEAWR